LAGREWQAALDRPRRKKQKESRAGQIVTSAYHDLAGQAVSLPHRINRHSA